MITLYVKTGCPYCQHVLDIVDELSIPVTLKNVADDGVSEEPIELGGKRQMPFMRDDETETLMYESELIGEYLQERFGSEA